MTEEEKQKLIKRWEDSGLLDYCKNMNNSKMSDSETNIALLLMANPQQKITSSDCQEDEGIAIGLIDGIIANLRVLNRHYSDQTGF